MKLLWWKRSQRAKQLDDERLAERLTEADTPLAKRVRRMRNGQDVEFEQMTAHLRNKHF